LLVFGECYANTCLAKVLIDSLTVNGGIKLVHKPSLGRDRIISKVFRAAKRFGGTVLAVIDYERGASREYVDVSFDLTEVCPGVFVGVGRKDRRVLAVVLDPDFEDGLLCVDREFGEVCESRDFLDDVKSSRACAVLADFLNAFAGGECFERLAKVLRGLLSGSGPQ